MGHDDMLNVREAGRKGGLATFQLLGRSHFAQIGRRGQLSLRQKHPSMAREWGRKGGRPRKLRLKEVGEEQ